MKSLWLVLVIVIFKVDCEENVDEQLTVVSPRSDSYLEAYTKSHSESGPIQVEKKSDREFNVNPQQQYGAPAYGPPAPAYGPPAPDYGPPAPAYGPPAPAYAPPAPAYAPPAPAYGPPAPAYGHSYAPAPIYGPPQQPFYGMPHGMLSILDKFKLKLDLFTIGKILLKLVIFKKIVSLIAILCLLLFIPALKHKEEANGDDNDEEMRNLKVRKSKADEKLNHVTEYVLGAIDNFSRKQNDTRNCGGVYCETEGYLKKINNKLSYKKLAKLYSKELS